MSTNPLSNMSYTNKDFQSIYVELLDLVKKLTYKWDPSISNESDPGVILLKLNAIIGDKNNYNIDKNILEAFPETLTQDFSARSLYRQLAYHMSWYESATTSITFKWIGEDQYAIDGSQTSGLVTSVRIPRYSMVCDAESKIIYTTLYDAYVSGNSPEVSVNAIEGTINDLTINGNKDIELINFDSFNRIYIDDMTVAENGIFVKNKGNESDDFWAQVDNVHLQELGSKCYEVGVDGRSGLLYLEFPRDIDKLIEDGLNIKYVLSNGVNGNVPSNQLDRFYQDVKTNVNGEDVVLDDTMIAIQNFSSSTNGKDPESIDDAYLNYRRTAGTFDTLVTLRDYMNAIFNSELVSNVVVCDRLNDIQSSYYIVNNDEYGAAKELQLVMSNDDEYLRYVKATSVYQTKPSTFIRDYFYAFDKDMGTMQLISDDATYKSADFDTLYCVDEDNLNKMDAFDLKLYMMQNPGIISDLESYKTSFNIVDSNSQIQKNVLGYINEQKCVQHNFKEIEPSIPFMFKNYFNLNMKVIPYHKIDEQEVNALKGNIIKSLANAINSRKLNFGEEANYEFIYDTILKSDERIKALVLDDFNYTTFAVYYDNSVKSFKEVPISLPVSKNIVMLKTSDENDVLAEIESYKNNSTYTYLLENSYFITTTGDIYRIERDPETKNYISTKYCDGSFVKDVRMDVVAKSILAGNTQLFNKVDSFEPSVDQTQLAYVKHLPTITTNLEVSPFGNDNTTLTKDSMLSASYTLGENESIRFLGPSFLTPTVYSNYIKYELVLNTNEEVRTTSLAYSSYITNSNHYNSSRATLHYEPTDTEYTDVKLDEPSHFNLDNDCYITVTKPDATGTSREVVWKGWLKAEFLESEIKGYDGKTYNGKDIIEDITTTSEPDDEELASGYYDFEIRAELTVELIKFLNVESTYGGMKSAESAWRSLDAKVYISETLYSIKPNELYRLKAGEYIVFFYKSEDDEEAPYKYEKYSEGSIICPNFVCYGVNSPIIDGTALGEKGEIPYDERHTSNYQTIKNLYGKNDLSGTKEISIKKFAEANLSLNDSYSYYFITNKTEKNSQGIDCYVMEPSEIGDGRYRYILDNDEYFFHVNASKTSFEMLSAGTSIIFDKAPTQGQVEETPDKPKLMVKKIDYQTIAVNGLSSFMSSLILIGNANVSIRENQIYSFSNGDTVTFTYNGNIDNEKGGSVAAPVLATGGYTDMSKFDISYISNDETGVLPSYDVGEGDSWIATSSLNLDCDNKKAQALHASDRFAKREVLIAGEEEPYEGELHTNYVSLLGNPVKPSYIHKGLISSYERSDDPIYNNVESKVYIYSYVEQFEYLTLSEEIYPKKPLWEKDKFFKDTISSIPIDKVEFDQASLEEDWRKFYVRELNPKTGVVHYVPYDEYVECGNDAFIRLDENYPINIENNVLPYKPSSYAMKGPTLDFVLELVESSTDGAVKIGDNYYKVKPINLPNNSTFNISEFVDSYLLEEIVKEDSVGIIETSWNPSQAIHELIATYIIEESKASSINELSDKICNVVYRGEIPNDCYTFWFVVVIDEENHKYKLCEFNSCISIEDYNTMLDKFGEPKNIVRACMEGSNILKRVKLWETYFKVVDSDTPKYLMSSVPLSKLGGSNIDISYFSMDGVSQSPDIYVYELNDNFNESHFTKNTDGSIVVSTGKYHHDVLNKGANEASDGSITFTLTNSNSDSHLVILPIDSGNSKFNIKLDEEEPIEPIEPINASTIVESNGSEYYPSGMYYFPIEVNNTEKKLELKWFVGAGSDVETGDHFIIHPMRRVEYNDKYLEDYNISIDEVKERVKELDVKNKFDYMYDVISDEKIDNPLKPIEFFNPYHFCNPFTMAVGDLYMSSDNDSNITMVNNR